MTIDAPLPPLLAPPRLLRQARLCYPCYRTPGVRDLYPGGRSPPEVEPSAAEVERVVAEQMADLPAWWPGPGERDTEE